MGKLDLREIRVPIFNYIIKMGNGVELYSFAFLYIRRYEVKFLLLKKYFGINGDTSHFLR